MTIPRSIEQRSLQGIIASGSAFAATVLQGIVLVPILLEAWGEIRYGAWVALWALVAMIISLDTGHQAYLGGEFNKQLSVDKLAMRATLASGLRVACLLGFVEVAIATGLGASAFLSPLLGLSAVTAANERVGVALAAMVALWVIPGSVGGILVRLYHPAGLFARAQWWGVAMRIVQAVSLGAAAAWGAGILAAGVFMSVMVLALNVALFVELRQTFQWAWPFWSGGSWWTGFMNLGRSVLLTGTFWLTQAQTSWVLVLVSSFLGAQAVAIFATLRTAANAILQGVQIVYGPLIPETVRYHVNREHAKLSAVFSAAWLMGTAASSAMLLMLAPFVETAYAVWTRGKLPFSAEVFALLCGAVLVRVVGAPLLNFLAGVNHLRAQATIAIAQAATVLAISLAGLKWIGLTGAAVAVLLAELIGSVGLAVWYARQEMRLSGGAFPIGDLVLGMGVVVIVAIVYVLRALGAPMGVALACGAAVFVVHHAQWGRLPTEVRRRLLRLVYVKAF